MEIDTGVSSKSWSDRSHSGGANAGSAAVRTGVDANGAADMEQPVHAQRADRSMTPTGDIWLRFYTKSTAQGY